MKPLRDWRYLLSRKLIKRKYLYRIAWDQRSILEACGSEDFNEPDILKKGRVFIDGGACYGFWTVRASPFYDMVYAFEPDKHNYEILRSNVRMNKLKNVKIFNAALGAIEGVVYFNEQGDGESSLLDGHMGKVATGKKTIVPIKTIDSFNLHPSVIKLDVEGSEIEALQGAAKTIHRFNPTLLVEVHEPVVEQDVMKTIPAYQWQTRWRYLNTDTYQFPRQPHLKGVPK